MGSISVLDYYYGAESEQFAFFRIPKALFKEERYTQVSISAKILYGLLLDRMALSAKNGWLDPENRVYIIYTIDEIAEDMSCERKKAMSLLAELDDRKGVGLIEKVRRGQGLPDIIYVKNFCVKEKRVEETETMPLTEKNSEKTADKPRVSAEVRKTDFKKSQKRTSRSPKNGLQEVPKTDCMNKTEINNIEDNNLSIHQSYNNIYSCPQNNKSDGWDGISAQDICQSVRIKTECDVVAYDRPHAAKQIKEIIALIVEILSNPTKTVRINGADYPYDTVNEQFMRFDRDCLEYVLRSLENAGYVRNMRAYLLTTIFNAPNTVYNHTMVSIKNDMRISS